MYGIILNSGRQNRHITEFCSKKCTKKIILVAPRSFSGQDFRPIAYAKARLRRWISFEPPTAVASSDEFRPSRCADATAPMNSVRAAAQMQQPQWIPFRPPTAVTSSNGFHSGRRPQSPAPMDSVQAAAQTQQRQWIPFGLPTAVASSNGFRPGRCADAAVPRGFGEAISAKRLSTRPPRHALGNGDAAAGGFGADSDGGYGRIMGRSVPARQRGRTARGGRGASAPPPA